jgi:hypothetical protein
MADRLFIAVLGYQRSGKSTTWKELFGRKVSTGSRPRTLKLSRSECVEVFLISGSNEERGKYAGNVLKNVNARIVLFSVQYVDEGRITFDYAFENGFDVYVQWLNPGYNQSTAYFDELGFSDQLLAAGATMAVRSGNRNARSRVREIKEFAFGWAKTRNLLFDCSVHKAH